MITPKETRREKLLSHGVPVAFLDAIESPPHEELKFVLCYPESAYFYLPSVESTYAILRGHDITPIFDGPNGDSYWVLLSNQDSYRFVHFTLETDEVFNDYGSDFMLLLAHTIIRFYENADELDESQIAEASRSVGFPQSENLISALALADRRGLRCTFESDAEWRREHLPQILKGNG